jgi:hypothetical protein
MPSAPSDDDAILALVSNLARPHSSGGQVIERAAIMASGADFAAIQAWILAHSGSPEQSDSPSPARGLHGKRLSGAPGRDSAPRRFVLPPGVL